MHQHELLTLLSDFGLSDVYVGGDEGVIAQINCSLTVVVDTKFLPNIAATVFCLMNAYPYRIWTVHVAVVDQARGQYQTSSGEWSLQLDS